MRFFILLLQNKHQDNFQYAPYVITSLVCHILIFILNIYNNLRVHKKMSSNV